MPRGRAHVVYQARSVGVGVSEVGAVLSFMTADDEEVTVTMNRLLLAFFYTHLTHAIAPIGCSIEQP